MSERTEGGLEAMFVPIGWLSGLPKNFRLLDSKDDHRFHSGTKDPFFLVKRKDGDIGPSNI